MSKKQRQYSAEFKLDTVLEGLRGDKPIAQLCRERGIRDTLYYKWREQFQAQAPGIFARQEQHTQAVSALEGRVAELERLVGKLALENEILKKATTWQNEAGRRNGR